MNKQPPKYAIRFFRWFCHPDYVDDIEGDLMERFASRPSKWRFTIEVLKLFRPTLLRSLGGSQKLNYYGMFKHYFKISYRNLLRHKSFAVVNIGGLVMGLTITLLIAMWIQDERSYDLQNEHYDRVARVMQHLKHNDKIETWLAIPHPLVVELRNQYGSDFEHLAISTWFGDYQLSHEENVISMRGGFMEQGAPHIMSLEMLQGNRDGLAEEAAIFLSQKTAQSLFGDEDPMNQSIAIYDEFIMVVKGVYQDFPLNSSFHGLRFIGSWDFFVSSQDWMQQQLANTNWDNNSFQLFAQIAENTSMEQVSSKIKSIKQEQLGEQEKQKNCQIFLHPLEDWHLKSSWKNGQKSGGLIQYIWWFGVIGTIVLLLACINFMNLSTSQSARRAKEVGIRKSIGSRRKQLIAQFLTESTLIVFISFILASAIAIILMPFFNQLTEKEMAIPIDQVSFWVIGLCFTMVVGLISGSYPAIYLSSFKAIQVLKGTYRSRLSAAIFRKSLVVFQFTISIALIITTFVIIQQIQHAISRPLGYDSEGTLAIEMSSGHYEKSQVIINELIATGAVTQVAQSSAPLTESWNRNTGFDWVGRDPDFNPILETYFVSHNYGETINWEVIEGRDFSSELASDSSAIILNQAAADYMGIDDPIGKHIKWYKEFKVIGITKNMIVESPYHKIEPAVFVVNPGTNVNFFLVRLDSEKDQLEAITKVEEVFESNFPNKPFDFNFVSDIHEQKFKQIRRVGTLSSVFAGLAIAISCLGLFGLSSFMMEQRTKEVGIRKVLGASVVALWKMLSKEFLFLVGIACLISIPIALLSMNRWLENYEYRIELKWWVFLAACLGSLLITLITVSFKSIRTAQANPVDSLKYE